MYNKVENKVECCGGCCGGESTSGGQLKHSSRGEGGRKSSRCNNVAYS